MSWFDKIKETMLGGASGGHSAAASASMLRQTEWQAALDRGLLPSFVTTRLGAASAGKVPWISTMTPSELRMGKKYGIRPLAMVSGTCWYHFGFSWSRGHAEGWRTALERLRVEAVAVGANAIVDVKMRRTELEIENSMDFTVYGTAVRIEGLTTCDDPVVATVSALEFIRLLKAGIVPVGIAIGAHYERLNESMGRLDARGSWSNKPLQALGDFWERVRRAALRELNREARQFGDGVLAHTHFSQLLKIEGNNREDPPGHLARYIVVGTVIHTRRSGTNVMPDIQSVVDMRDEESPLLQSTTQGHNAYPVEEEDGAI